MPVHSLSSAQLRAPLSPQRLGLADTTALVGREPGWIGQPRAEQAARLGLRMHHEGCHVIVVGSSGRGRTTQMLRLVQEAARTLGPAPDLCFVHDFERPQHPAALHLPSGQGRMLAGLMDDFVQHLIEEIPAALAGDHFLVARERIVHRWKTRDAQAYAQLQAQARERNVVLTMEEGRIALALHDETGALIDAGQLQALDEPSRERIRDAEDSVRNLAVRYVEASRVDDRAMHDEVAQLIRVTVLPVIDRGLHAVRHGLRHQLKDAVALSRHLARVRQAVLDAVELFIPGEDDDAQERHERDAWTSQLRVHVAVDHHDARHAPVVVEDSPGARRLFGGIDHQWIDGELRMDFSGIRAGSLMRAHGGYLLIDLDDLMEDEVAWRKMQRFLRSGCCQVEEAAASAQPINPFAIDPEPVPLSAFLTPALPEPVIGR